VALKLCISMYCKEDGTMKDRNIVLVLVIAVLFLMLTPHFALGATSGKTAQLTIYNLSGGG
jgi:hypothetical protein